MKSFVSVVRVPRFRFGCQLPVGWLAVEDKLFDLRRVGCQQMQEGLCMFVYGQSGRLRSLWIWFCPAFFAGCSRLL